jgi:hypothetical protein
VSKLILDDELRAKLNGLDETVEICDPSGATVGHFVPEEEYMRLMYAWAKTEVSLEELKRRAAEPGGMKLADFWKQMGEASRHTTLTGTRLHSATWQQSGTPHRTAGPSGRRPTKLTDYSNAGRIASASRERRTFASIF